MIDLDGVGGYKIEFAHGVNIVVFGVMNMATLTEQKPIGIQVTDKASKAVRRIAVKEGRENEDFGLRVGSRAAGARGFCTFFPSKRTRPWTRTGWWTTTACIFSSISVVTFIWRVRNSTFQTD